MSFFRGEQLQAKRNLELEKKRLRLQNDPSAIFMRELSAGLPRAAFQTLGSMAVDAARYNLFGGKEKLALQERAQDVSEAAEKRQQEGQDFQAAALLAGPAQRQFAQEKGLDYLVGGQPAKPKQTVKQFPDGTFGVEVAPEQADFSTEDKKSYKRITAEEAKKLQEPKKSENPYLRDALKNTGYENVNNIPFVKERNAVLKKAVDLRDKDIAQATKEIENYAKALDTSLPGGGTLQSEAGRRAIIKNVKQFVSRMKSSYPGLDLSNQLTFLENIEETRLNENTMREMKKFLVNGARILQAQAGKSNFQATRDLNKADELFLDRLRENQESLQRQGALLAEEAKRLGTQLNPDGSLKQGVTVTPALDRYNKRRQRFIADQEKLRKDAFKNKRRAERLQLTLTPGAFGQEQIRFGSTVMKDLGAKADKSLVARSLISGDSKSFNSLYSKLSDDQKKQYAASSVGISVEQLDGLLGTTQKDTKGNEYKVPETVDGFVSSMFDRDADRASNSLITFANKEAVELIGGSVKGRQAPEVDENIYAEKMNDQGFIETVIRKRARETESTIEDTRAFYAMNPDALGIDVKIEIANPKTPFTITQDELDKSVAQAMDSIQAFKGTTPASANGEISTMLKFKDTAIVEKVRKNQGLTAEEAKDLGTAFRRLSPESPLKGASPVESSAEAVLKSLAKKFQFTEEEVSKIRDAKTKQEVGDIFFIKANE